MDIAHEKLVELLEQALAAVAAHNSRLSHFLADNETRPQDKARYLLEPNHTITDLQVTWWAYQDYCNICDQSVAEPVEYKIPLDDSHWKTTTQTGADYLDNLQGKSAIVLWHLVMADFRIKAKNTDSFCILTCSRR